MKSGLQISDVISRNVGSARTAARSPLRPDKSMSQRELAEQMGWFGITWTQSTVALIESAQRNVSAIELIALSVVLETPLATLLDAGDDKTVSVGESRWPASLLGRVALGDVVDLPASALPRDFMDQVRVVQSVATLAPTLRELTADFWDRWDLEDDDLTANQYRALIEPKGSTEREAAKRLRSASRSDKWLHDQITPSEVAAAAWKTWGRSFDEEQDRRVEEQARSDASETTKRTIRGHVTREMDAKLLRVIRGRVRKGYR